MSERIESFRDLTVYKESPLHNAIFFCQERKAKILTGGIH
jgi:hypothetical protein